MRPLALSSLLLAVLAVSCGSEDGTAASAATRLTITMWPQGSKAGGMQRWTLECGPAGGTHPNAAKACARLASLAAPFKPVPADAMCTQIYGGPAEALVTGTFRGRPVNARFKRTDGCEIARWNRIAALFPISADA